MPFGDAASNNPSKGWPLLGNALSFDADDFSDIDVELCANPSPRIVDGKTFVLRFDKYAKDVLSLVFFERFRHRQSSHNRVPSMTALVEIEALSINQGPFD